MNKKWFALVAFAAALYFGIPAFVDLTRFACENFDKSAARYDLADCAAYFNLLRVLVAASVLVVAAEVLLSVFVNGKFSAWLSIGLIAVLAAFLIIGAVTIPTDAASAAMPHMSWRADAAALYARFRDAVLMLIVCLGIKKIPCGII
jgi:uncharacterized protein (DUF983 family)